MTDPITIPPEALEAAAIEMAPAPWSMYTEDAQEHFRRKARAACLAMLRAWPGMHIHEWQRPWLGGMSGTDIILPLTQEPSDELRAMWEDDNEALTYLEGRGIKEPERNGILVIPNGFDLTNKDVAAIRYLMDEWDYAWRQIGNDGTND